MKKQSWVVCVLFREIYGEIEYLLVTSKPKAWESYEYRFPAAPQFVNKTALEAAEWAVDNETGYRVIYYRNNIEPMDFGKKTIQLFVARAISEGTAQSKAEDLMTRWYTYDEAWHLMHGLLKKCLDKADLYLRETLSLPFLRRGIDPAFKPAIKQAMKMCGPLWTRIQEAINDENEIADKQKRAVGEVVIHDSSLDLVGVMHVFPLVVALHKYFQRIFVLDSPHRLLILPYGTDTKVRMERSHGSDWDSVADTVIESFPLAVDALRNLSAKVRASEDGFGLIEPATPEQATQLRRLMAMFHCTYAMENRLRALFAMCPNGTVVARSLLNCPKRYRDAISLSTLLRA